MLLLLNQLTLLMLLRCVLLLRDRGRPGHDDKGYYTVTGLMIPRPYE
jgi:hypothetical protein